MATYRFVAYDIEKSLKKTGDDADITLPQIVYWIQVVANSIRYRNYLVSKSDLYTSTFSSVPVLTDIKGRKYIDLPIQVMDTPDESGVVYLTYNEETCCCSGPAFAQVNFQHTRPAKSAMLYGDPYTSPSSKNPYYYRIGDRVDGVKVNRIYFLGLECVDITDVEIAVLGTLNPSQVCDLDEEISLPDENIYELITEVLTLGKFVTLIPSEAVNQGADNSMPVQTAVPQSQSNTSEQ